MDSISNLIFPITLTGVPILALIGIGCLFRCKGAPYYKYLVWTAAVFLGTMALMLGGEILLGFFHLTWRNLTMLVLCGTMLVSGWVGIILTMVCVLSMEMPKYPKALRWVSKGVILFFAAEVLLVTLWAGPLALLFGFVRKERAVEYQGQTLLEVDDGFMDPHFSYYRYCGPLVRGTERLYDEYRPLGGK